MEIIDYDGTTTRWYMLDLQHYNEEWLRWIIADLYEKLKDSQKETNKKEVEDGNTR